MRGEEVVAGGIVIPERSVAPVIGRNMDAENHQRPDDGGGQRQRLEVSSERGGGPPGEPGEPEHDRADARPDDRAVREGIDVRANESETHDRTRQGAEQGRPRRPRSQEEENRSHDQAAECPHSREDGVVVIEGTVVEIHEAYRNMSRHPWATAATEPPSRITTTSWRWKLAGDCSHLGPLDALYGGTRGRGGRLRRAIHGRRAAIVACGLRLHGRSSGDD